MDFNQPTSHHQANAPKASEPTRRRKSFPKWLSFSYSALLFSGTILVVALVVYLGIGGPVKESKYVKTKQYQAVFLNNGQVYFGKITNLSEKYTRLSDIYYLRQNQTVQDQKKSQDNSFLLAKLGCELHGPDDEMLVNRDQVLFWENLKSDGSVVKKIAEFKQQNPDGQKCDATTQSTTQSPASTNN